MQWTEDSGENVKISILQRGGGWLLVDKPAGMETVVTGGGNTKYCFTSYLRRQLEGDFLRPAHRLDRDTSGCLLMCDREEVLPELEELFREKKTDKRYLAICLGAPKAETDVISRNLTPWDGGRRPVRVGKGPDTLNAVTEYQLLGKSQAGKVDGVAIPKISLIRFRPLTGRTHQVRVHAAALGLPIIGDDQYGDRKANKVFREKWGLVRQALHAWRLHFPAPETGKKIKVEAHLPPDMTAVLDAIMPDWKAALAPARKG